MRNINKNWAAMLILFSVLLYMMLLTSCNNTDTISIESNGKIDGEELFNILNDLAVDKTITLQNDMLVLTWIDNEGDSCTGAILVWNR